MKDRNKTPTEQDDRGREDGNNGRVTAFLHNSIDNRDSETAEDGGVKSRMSEPAALREGQSGYEERRESGLNLNRNTPCDRDFPVFSS